MGPLLKGGYLIVLAAIALASATSCQGNQQDTPDRVTQQVPTTIGDGQIERVQVEYGDDQVVNLFVLEPEDAPANAPLIMAFPWGRGSGDLVLSLLQRYWDREAPARGYIVVGVEILGPRLETEGAQMIPAIFQWMDENFSYDAERVVATGASNGGRGLFFAGVAAPQRYAAFIAMPGGYAEDEANLKPLRGKPVWLLVGEQDTSWREFGEATKAKLEAQGVDVTYDVLPGQGHVLNIGQAVLMDLIDALLEREAP
ncbi:MAG: hypothetical protein GKR89_00905 [Candidatus Latescibacteria bacterium]|nr:hypothetical protein [Candidatus Latescibacterota bacterium]